MTDNDKKEITENPQGNGLKPEQKDLNQPLLDWQYCPRCGGQILRHKSPKYCTYCGLDLVYLKEHKTLPPQEIPTIKSEFIQNAQPNTSLSDSHIVVKPYDTTIPSLKEQNIQQESEIEWLNCPRCGYKLLKNKKQKFCLNCGLDFLYVKNYKIIPPIQPSPQPSWYPPPQQYPTYNQPSQQYPTYNQPPQQYPTYNQPPQQYPAYNPPAYLPYTKLSDAEILNTKGRKLWGAIPSLGIPLLAFVLMNVVVLAVFILIIAFTANVSLVMNFITNPYFIVLSTLMEFVLIVFPLIYVGKYLEHPTLKNRLTLLGFTSKEYSRKSVTKEVFIGLLFAGVGIFLVAFTTILAEIIIELVFGIDIVQVAGESSSDVDFVISAADVVAILMLVATMILVVGVCEEILFRGFMQRGLTRNLGEKGGIFLTAFIFAIIHLVVYMLNIILALMVGDGGALFENGIMFLLAFPPYLAVSFMLGFLYRWRNENLIAVIITHGVYNSLTILIAFFYFLSY